MTLNSTTPYRIVISELRPDGTIHERLAGDASAYIVAITAEPKGELRILTDPDGPPEQRRKALANLTAHLNATIGIARQLNAVGGAFLGTNRCLLITVATSARR